MRTSEKSVSFTSEELRARSAAGLSTSNWEWVRTHEPDLTDPDAPDFSEEMRAERLRRRGRPKGSGVKSATSIRIDKDVLAAFRATGRGWQTRMNDALRAWIEDKKAPRRKTRDASEARERAAPKALARR